jgi:hypothetical protein
LRSIPARRAIAGTGRSGGGRAWPDIRQVQALGFDVTVTKAA